MPSSTYFMVHRIQYCKINVTQLYLSKVYLVHAVIFIFGHVRIHSFVMSCVKHDICHVVRVSGQREAILLAVFLTAI